MFMKAYGLTDKPIQTDLRFGCDDDTADRVTCFRQRDKKGKHPNEPKMYAFEEPRTFVQDM